VAVSGGRGYIVNDVGSIVSFNPWVRGDVDCTDRPRSGFTPVEAVEISVWGEYACTLHMDGYLMITDVCPVRSAVVTANLLTEGFPTAIECCDGKLYATNKYLGLQTIDIPSGEIEDMLDLPGTEWDIAIDRGYAYIASLYSGLTIVKLHPEEGEDRVVKILPEYEDDRIVAFSGNYAAISGIDYPNEYFHVLDATDPENPVFIGSVSITETIRDIEIAGNYIYLTVMDTYGYLGGLRIYAVDGNRNVVESGRLTFERCYAYAVELQDNRAYITTSCDEIVVADISDPVHPSIVEKLEAGEYTDDIAVSGNMLYATDYMDGLMIFRMN